MDSSKKIYNLINSLLILLPFILIFGGVIFQNTYPQISSLSKYLAIVYVVIYIILHGKFNLNLVLLSCIFIPFLVYGISISFNLKAGLSDGVRYLFPIITLFFSYAIRRRMPLLLKFLIIFIIINFFTQIVNYINWLRGVDQWFYYVTKDGVVYNNSTAGILRATGTVVLFALYGFMNMIAFFIISKYYEGKYKKVILFIALFGIFASLSYKTLGTFFIILLLYYIKYFFKVISIIFIFIASIYLTVPEKFNRFVADILMRVQLYLTEGGSARAESYRVMFDEILKGNFFGKGVGLFGGPASTDYNSPYYNEVGFRWYDAKWLNLPTTDTYPPHLFVELGIIGGIVYLMVILTPLLNAKLGSGVKMVLLVYFTLFVDMLFSFSLNNLEFLFMSMIFVYPILYHDKIKNNCHATN